MSLRLGEVCFLTRNVRRLAAYARPVRHPHRHRRSPRPGSRSERHIRSPFSRPDRRRRLSRGARIVSVQRQPTTRMAGFTATSSTGTHPELVGRRADVALASAACSGVATVAGAEPLALGCGFATKVFGYTAVAATGINMVAASQNGDWETVAQDATALLAGGVTRQALGVGGWRLDEAGRRGADLLDQVVATLTDWTFK